MSQAGDILTQKRALVTVEQLRCLLRYDPKSGHFWWLMAGHGRQTDRPAGSAKNQTGYIAIGVNYRVYFAHRLAWFYMTNKWPTVEIDHKDRNRTNNVWTNLREATQSGNNANRPMMPANSVGLKGVSVNRKSRRNPYTAYVQSRYIGSFPTAEDAHEAYCHAAREAYGEFWSPD